MNHDEIHGKSKKLKGRMKEGAGELTDDEHLRQDGGADRAEGEAQDAWGRGKRRVGDAIEDAGERLKEPRDFSVKGRDPLQAAD